MRCRFMLVFMGLVVGVGVIRAQNPSLWGDKWTGHLKDQPTIKRMQTLAKQAIPLITLYVLDSTATREADSTGTLVTTEAETYNYDEFMRFNCQARYNYSPTMGQMLPLVKDSVIFRADGRIDTIYTYYGNVIQKASNDWWLGAYEVHEYNADTQKITLYSGDPSQGYRIINRYVYVYYPDDNLKEVIYYEADSLGNLLPETRREYLRDNNGLLTQETGYSFYMPWNSWIYSDRTEYFYIGNLNHLTFYYLYDPGNMQWQNSAKELNFYDAQGRLIERQRYTWEPSLGSYVASTSYTQSYTPLGDPDTLIQFVSYDGTSFVPTAKFVNVFDGVNNPVESQAWGYNLSGFEWVPVEKQVIDYNNTIGMEELLWPLFIDSMYMRHQPLEVYNYSWDGGGWNLYRTMEIFYKHRNFTGTEAIASGTGVRVYPNPFGEVIQLSGEGSGYMELSDLAGHRVLFTPLRLPAVVSAQGLPAGVYVYKLFVRGQTYCGKIIKR
ncbi:MAG: T9SS type A sorting domain-containing protein [Bacteroidales bacterium]